MTVSTFFPDAHEETTSVDGHAEHNDAGGLTWAAMRAAAGNASDPTNPTGLVQVRADTITDMFDLFDRAILLFDTASLPDEDTVSAATFELVVTNVFDNFAEAGSIAIVESTPATNTNIVDADYTQVGSTRQATDRTAAGLTADSSTFNAWILNATGLASISLTGVTKFGMRVDFDLDNAEPTWAALDRVRLTWATAEEILADDKRPRLVVTHEPAAAAGPEVPAAGIGQMAGNAPHSFRTRMVGT